MESKRLKSPTLVITEAILELARKQHGVVSRQQLLDLGMTTRLVDERLSARRLTRIYPGVYGLGPGVTSQRGLWLAATLSCGRRVALCRRSAAMLWGLSIEFDPVEVVSGSMRRARIDAQRDKALIVHQTRTLPDRHLSLIDGIPVTSVSRTLIDLAGMVSEERIESLFHEADRMRILDADDLSAELANTRGRKGVASLRRLLSRRSPRNRFTRSHLESKFLDFCAERNLPTPLVNRRVLGLEVDCYWPEIKFIIELDGLAFHSMDHDIERDHRRDAKLQSAGFLILRLTFRDVTETPDRCETVVRSHMVRARKLAGI